MNVGTMIPTAAADPVQSLSSSGGSVGTASDEGGFAAVLREAGAPTDDATAAPDAGDGAAGTEDGQPATETGDAGEAAAAQLLVAWQRSTTTGLAVVAPTATSAEAATTTAAPAIGPAATVLPDLLPQGDASIEAAVLPATDPAVDDPLIDLTGMQAVPETPLETGEPETGDRGTEDLAIPASGEGPGSSPTAPDRGAHTAAPSGAPTSTAPTSTPSTSHAPAAASTPAGASTDPVVEPPAAETPVIDPAAPATLQATARADAVAAPTATIRADELQRAIADTARQLADQGGGRHRISVHLTSPDLGQVVIEIVSRGSEVRVTLQPQDAGVGGSLQQQQQAVARALATEGFTLSGFDVQTGHPDGRGREDVPQEQRGTAVDDDLVDLTAIDDGALRL